MSTSIHSANDGTKLLTIISSVIPPAQAADAGETAIELNCLIIGDAEATVAPSSVMSVETPQPTVAAEKQKEIKRLFVLSEEARKAGDRELIRRHLKAILEIDPSNGLAHFNLGVLNRDSKAYPEAEADFRRAIKSDPQKPLYHRALGELMQMMRHLLFAAEAYEAGLAVDPNNIEMLNALMGVRQKQRMPREVVELSRRSLALDPQSSDAMIHLAWASLWLGESETAAEVAGRALALEPQSMQAAAMLQTALARLGRKDAAAAALADIEARAVKTWDKCAAAADAFMQLDEAETAENLLRLVIERQPNFVPALLQLGRYMIVKSNFEEGLRLMSRVVELDPEEGDAQTSVALSLVFKGEYEEGWARHHWRWKRTGCEPKWDLPMPEWQGQPLGDGSLLLWREQGIGDMVMYAAPAIACREFAKKVVIETNPRLRALLQRSFPDMLVVCRENIPEGFFVDHNIAAHCPIGDLPYLLKTDMGNFPGRDGFLAAHPTEVARLRERYQLLFPGKRLVGISWRSGNSSSAVTRSVELPLWMPIFETADCAFISLQYGDIRKDVEALREEHGVEIYIDPEVNSMLDMDRFAAQVAAIDVVISVDNSTVHVAGALGKSTWVLIPSASDWRWLTRDRRDTVWYRSVELFRQEPKSSWEPQIHAIATRLQELSMEQIAAERQALYLRCAEQSYTFGDNNTAELYFRQILAKDQGHAAALAGLGQIALYTGYFEDALGFLRRAVEVAPEIPDYHRDLARALHAGGRREQAFDAVREALRLASDDVESLVLGIEVLRQLDNAAEAANYCARLLRLDPDNREARLHLGQMQAAAGDFDVAETNFQRILTQHPDDDAAVFSLGCLAFRREDLVAGWTGFTRRFQVGLPRPQSELSLPPLQQIWDKSSELSHARVAVRSEPGLKDQLLFMRWLTALRSDTNFVAAELDPRLIPFIDQGASRIGLFPTGSLRKEEVEDLGLTAQIALGDLGSRYGLDIAQLSNSVPYLKFDHTKAASMRQDYLAALSARRLIGICWRGGEMAIPLIEWLPVLRLQDFGFVSLQAGPAQQEMHEVFEGLNLSAIRDPAIDPQSNLRGFAAQIAAVDLVISIDEVPAHLAGALGVPTICCLPHVADWRWFGESRQDSPWYPTMQVYRQGAADHDWSNVMNKIEADLQTMILNEGRMGIA